MKLLFCFCTLLLVLLRPDSASSAARNALSVWGLDVVPSLFPYMVLCKLLSEQLKTKKLPAFPVVITLGALGGSPSGAAVLSSYACNLSRRQLYALSALTGTISPMFFIGTLRQWKISAQVCRKLLIAHIAGAVLSAVCVYIFFGCFQNKKAAFQNNIPASESNPIAQSVFAVLHVGGCILFFSVIAACFSSFFTDVPDVFRAVFHALLEIAGGLHALSTVQISTAMQGLLLSVLTGFGGFSILTQNFMFLKDCGVRQIDLIVFAFLRSLFSLGAMAVLLSI